MDRKAELVDLERARWDEFRTLIERISPDRMNVPTLNADGWSVKDLLWHIRCWDDEIADQLARIRLGTYVDEEYDTDEKNARFVEEGRRTDLTTVQTEWLAARARARKEMAGVSEITPPVEEWFSELAYRHMDDHLPELRAFVDGTALSP
jgi:hypothetical protein